MPPGAHRDHNLTPNSAQATSSASRVTTSKLGASGQVTGRLATSLNGAGKRRQRYALYRRHVLQDSASIEPISEHIPDQVPLGKAQRLDRLANESPALPLSYSAMAERF
jgi:hypothetical protein